MDLFFEKYSPLLKHREEIIWYDHIAKCNIAENGQIARKMQVLCRARSMVLFRVSQGMCIASVLSEAGFSNPATLRYTKSVH